MKLTAILLSAAAVAALSTGAMAADLAMPSHAAYVAAPATNWDGPYIGANLGYAWGTSTDADDSSISGNTSGFQAGVQAGYNFHVADSIVVGVQGDIDWSNQSGTNTDIDVTANERWSGALVGRVGVDMGEWLPYVEAGVAFSNADGGPTGGTMQNATYTGWTVGAGVQVMLAQNLSADVEYRYNNYGTQTYYGYKANFNDSQIRVGLNWHF